MDYFKKYEDNPAEDLRWNISEQKQGIIAVAGGNGQSFRTVAKTAEWIGKNYHLEEIKIVLPDSLQGKLPPVPGLVFVKSTESGSLADEEGLMVALETADYGVLVGDFSKNTTTEHVIAKICDRSMKPLLITRDTVDLLASGAGEKVLMNENLVLMASVAQLTKLLRAVYYPKMLTMSQSLVQVAEVLHKFTLSYPVSIVTLHNGQLVIAKSGEVAVVPMEKSGYSPITMWDGELAAKIAIYNMYNPNNFMKATICACFE